MKTEILILRPGERPERASAHLPDDDSLGLYKALKVVVEPITGEPMEHVRVFARFDDGDPFDYRDMFVNECGRIDGMPRNERATQLYRNNVMMHEIHPPPLEGLPWIAGPAVLFRDIVWR